MDEHECIAFELEVRLYKVKRVYPRDELGELYMEDNIKRLRELSRTYRRPLGVDRHGKGYRGPSRLA